MRWKSEAIAALQSVFRKEEPEAEKIKAAYGIQITQLYKQIWSKQGVIALKTASGSPDRRAVPYRLRKSRNCFA
jgi:hypothetical protein